MQLRRQKSRYYPRKGENYYDQNSTISEFLDQVKPKLIGKKIIDIGAGELPFHPFYEDLNVETCDIQNNSTQTINHIIEPNGKLPFQNASYDAIFIFDVLEHVKSDVLFLKECHRILKPGGIIIATIPFIYRFHEIPYDFRRYTQSGVENIFQTEASFEKLNIKNVGSLLFVVYVLLTEHQLNLKNLFRKIIFKLLVKFINLLIDRKEISPVAPFAFFVTANKPLK